jgi:hypothetical protein
MPPAAIVGGLGALGSIGGAVIGSNAANSAAEKQAQATKEANELQYKMFQEQSETQKGMYDQQRQDLEPWRKAGVGALSQLGNADFQRDFTMNDFEQDPGYQFRMAEGQKALERSAAARGGLQSGGTLKALAKYGQDFASNEYGNAYNRFNSDRDRRFNRLSSLAGIGQTANSQLGNAGSNYANQFSAQAGNLAGNVGNNLTGLANAQGAAGMAGANAWGNALGNIGNLGMQGLWMNQWNKSQGGATS